MTTSDPRQAAIDRTRDLIALVKEQPSSEARTALLDECEALARAIEAFHMEGIRFRTYNVDRLLHKGGISLPAAAGEAFSRTRQHLEEAGFHTRSHQAPV